MRLTRLRLIWPMWMRPTKLLLTRPRPIWPMRMQLTKSLKPTISPSQNTICGVNCSLVFEVTTINWVEWFGAASAPLIVNICWGLMQVLMVSLSLLEWGPIVSLWLEAQFLICSDLLSWQEPTIWVETQFPTLSDFLLWQESKSWAKAKFPTCFVTEAHKVTCTFNLHLALPQVNQHIIQDRCNNQLECCRRLVLLDLILLSKMQMAHSSLCWSPFGIATSQSTEISHCQQMIGPKLDFQQQGSD